MEGFENTGHAKPNEQRTPRRKKSALQRGKKNRQSLNDIQEVTASQTGDQPQRPQTPWEAFESHVKNIHDDSGQYISPNTQGLQLKSSDTFQKVMTDINHKRREKELREIKRQEEAARLRMEKLQTEGEAEQKEDIVEEENESEEEDSEEEEEEIVIEASPGVKMAAMRGWAIIRRKIQELRMERKNEADQSWSILKNTLKNMTNMEKAREELYEKYIYKPNTWKDGIKNFPDHLAQSNRSGYNINSKESGKSLSRTVKNRSASSGYVSVSGKYNNKTTKKRKNVPLSA